MRKPRGKKPSRPAAGSRKVIRARYDGTCFSCGKAFRVGDKITNFRDLAGSTYWGHPACAAAHGEMARNKARIEAGETFAGTPASYQRKTRRRDKR